MQLHQNAGVLAGDTADSAEDSEDVRTSDEPVPAYMADEYVPGTNKVTSGLGPVLRSGVESIDAVKLSRLLTEQAGSSTVIVDCRPYLAYSSSHIVGAHNVCYPSLLERRRLRRLTGTSANHVLSIPLENIVRCDEVRQAVADGQCQRIVVYDEDTQSIQASVDTVSLSDRGCRDGPQLISVLRSLAEFTVCELHFLHGLLF